MMERIKMQKGITVITLSVAVIIMLILTATMIYNVKNNLGVEKLRYMQNDIANIREKVSAYYAQYGAIPISNEYTNATNLSNINVISDAVDTGKFYVIDLSALENLTLMYGKDYEKIRQGRATTTEQIDELKDIYIINEDSHNIFYVQGIKFDNEYFYTDYTTEEIDTTAVSIKTVIEICSNTNMFNKTENTIIKDEYGNRITIPAGFRLVVDETTNNATHVTEGMVVEDSEGNQFVWVPVGKIYTTTDESTKQSTAKTITLSRYEFADGTSDYTDKDENTITAPAEGTAIDKGTTAIADSYDSSYTHTEDTTDYDNTKAIDIEAFKTSAATNSGYYIARYEASYGTDGKANSKISTGYSESIAPTTEGTLWNLIAQPDAATASRKMYEGNSNYISDLVNSYAWDTAIVFIQTCGGTEYKAYSRKKGQTINSSLTNTGVNNDKPLNICDMSGNIREWTTETISNSNSPCTTRGGLCGSSVSYTSYRGYTSGSDVNRNFTFRPILYLN